MKPQWANHNGRFVLMALNPLHIVMAEVVEAEWAGELQRCWRVWMSNETILVVKDLPSIGEKKGEK